MKSMKNNKTSGNGGLKKICKTFLDELKTPLMKNINQAFHTKTLSTSQRQACHQAHWEKRQGPGYIKYGDQVLC